MAEWTDEERELARIINDQNTISDVESGIKVWALYTARKILEEGYTKETVPSEVAKLLAIRGRLKDNIKSCTETIASLREEQKKLRELWHVEEAVALDSVIYSLNRELQKSKELLDG